MVPDSHDASRDGLQTAIPQAGSNDIGRWESILDLGAEETIADAEDHTPRCP